MEQRQVAFTLFGFFSSQWPIFYKRATEQLYRTSALQSEAPFQLQWVPAVGQQRPEIQSHLSLVYLPWVLGVLRQSVESWCCQSISAAVPRQLTQACTCLTHALSWCRHPPRACVNPSHDYSWVKSKHLAQTWLKIELCWLQGLQCGLTQLCVLGTSGARDRAPWLKHCCSQLQCGLNRN